MHLWHFYSLHEYNVPHIFFTVWIQCILDTTYEHDVRIQFISNTMHPGHIFHCINTMCLTLLLLYEENASRMSRVWIQCISDGTFLSRYQYIVPTMSHVYISNSSSTEWRQIISHLFHCMNAMHLQSRMYNTIYLRHFFHCTKYCISQFFHDMNTIYLQNLMYIYRTVLSLNEHKLSHIYFTVWFREYNASARSHV